MKNLVGAWGLGVQLLVLSDETPLNAMCLRHAHFHQAGEPLRPATDQPSWRTLAGISNLEGTNDGPGITARFSVGSPLGITVAPNGEVFVADSAHHVIRRIDPAGVVSTWAGTPSKSGHRNAKGTAALFSGPSGLVLDAGGNLYVTDTGNHMIRKVDPAGVVSDLAGDPDQSGYRDGVGQIALFNAPDGIALETNGTLYVSDSSDSLIRKISPLGEVTTLAGWPGGGVLLDGTGTNAFFRGPRGLAVDAAGNVFVADRSNGAIRKITPAGVVTTLDISSGQLQWSLYDGYYDGPTGVVLDGAGTLYVATASLGSILRVSAAGLISIVGGSDNGKYGWAEPADGPGPFAHFIRPESLALDSHGHLFVADSGAGTIRYGSSGLENRPRFMSQPSSQTVQAGSSARFQVQAESLTPVVYQWLVNGEPIREGTNATLDLPDVSTANSGKYQVAISDGVGYILSFPAYLEVAPTKSGTPLDHWQPVSSLALANLRAMAFGNGRYVAVGESGRLVTSADGVQWVTHWPVTGESLNGVTFGNGRFVAVGSGGAVLTSEDGLAWVTRSLTTEARPGLDGVAFDQGLFIAVSGDVNGSIWSSPDGEQWVNRVLGFNQSFMAVAGSGRLFVAVGNTILGSTNGLDWEPANVPSGIVGTDVLFTHLAYGNGLFLATEAGQSNECHSVPGLTMSSLGGRDWQATFPTNALSLSGISFGNGVFVAIDASSGGLCRSEDGASWTPPSPVMRGEKALSSPGLAFAQGIFAVADPQEGLAVSSNAVSWEFYPQQQAIPFIPADMVAVNGAYLAVGLGIQSSTDGVSWQSMLNSTNSGSFSTVAYGNGRLVSLGLDVPRIITSLDGGTNWIDTTPDTLMSDLRWLRVTFGNGVFIVGGVKNATSSAYAAHVLVSKDGLDWQAATIPGVDSVQDLAFGDGWFVAVGFNPTQCRLLTSSNGTSWQIVNSFKNMGWNSIAFGNHTFVIGGSGVSLSSPNTTDWSLQALPGASIISKVAFGNGQFVAATDAGIFGSPDGRVWTRSADLTSSFNTVVAGDGVFLAANHSGLYRSAPFEQLRGPQWLPSGQLTWSVAGAPAITYSIESSQDLLNWQTLLSVTNAPANYPFVDPGVVNNPIRFYRVVTH